MWNHDTYLPSVINVIFFSILSISRGIFNLFLHKKDPTYELQHALPSIIKSKLIYGRHKLLDLMFNNKFVQ
jgi:hypothetical protein